MSAVSQVAVEKWLPLLRQSSREVFEIMLGSRLEPAQPEKIGGVEFTAMVGLAGCVCGVLSLHCGHQSATLVAARMLHLAPEQAAEHAWDALGEVANMVAGNFKNKIDHMSDKCLLSVPTVITGADYAFHSLADSGPMTLWFRFDGKPLQVTLEIHL
jgi:chemotaxis protein CheX